MKILIIKHIDIEGPGLIENILYREKIPFHILNLEKGVSLPDVDDFSHMIILGGPMGVYEEDKYPFLRDEDIFIKESINTGKHILGICLGAQLIAKALGAKVFRAPVKEIGWYNILLTEDGLRDPIFSEFPQQFPAFQWHGDTFELPYGARLLATSSPITHQAFRYDKNIYALQFHLEVTWEIIEEWMEAYEEEFKDSEKSTFSKNQIRNLYRKGDEVF
ncbi:MAG: type 1 glutamine amidotransferase [Thermodesulfobacteriota bacterium]